MSNPLVSIALCSYNGEKYLREQLDSLLRQSYNNIEIICLDDDSSDGTYTILEEYHKRFEHIRIFKNERNLGYRKNFEKAVSLCSGEFIALCDQDDIWHRDKIDILVRHIGKNQLIYHDSEFICEDGTSMNMAVSDVCNFYRGNDCRHFLLENCVSGHACMFRKSLVPFLVPFPENVHHDWWLAYIACNHGSIDYVNRRLVKYRQHANSCTNILRLQRNEKAKKEVLKIRKEAERAKVFANRSQKHMVFVDELVNLLYSRMTAFISLKLFFFLMRNQHYLLYMQKKSLLSKFNFCLRLSWGFRAKNIF